MSRVSIDDLGGGEDAFADAWQVLRHIIARPHNNSLRRRCRRQPHKVPAARPHPQIHAPHAGSWNGVFRPAPLYTTKIGDEIHRAFTEEERDQLTQDLAKGNRKAENIRWQRFKGLGEMNVDELAECALNPETRILRKMTIQDAQAAEAAAQMFATLMGSNVEARRDYLTANSTLIPQEALDI